MKDLLCRLDGCMLLLPLSLGPSCSHLGQQGWQSGRKSECKYEKVRTNASIETNWNLHFLSLTLTLSHRRPAERVGTFCLGVVCIPCPGLRKSEAGDFVGAERAAGQVPLLTEQAGQQVTGPSRFHRSLYSTFCAPGILLSSRRNCEIKQTWCLP